MLPPAIVTPWRANVADRVRGVERLEQHRRHAEREHHHEVVGPADVRERERDRADVVRLHLERVRQAHAAGDETAVGVHARPSAPAVVPDVE